WGRRQGQPLYAGLGAGLLGSLLALAVHGMTDAVTWGMVRPAPIVWALWGLAVAAGALCRAPAAPAVVSQPAAPPPAVPPPAALPEAASAAPDS
ncbi:MAG: hypothetical protein ACKOC5_16835, partial [Chloroflexota bacterium]